MLILAMLLLALSGVATLTYQVVWVRLLGLSLGVSTESVATVLAAFFLGLALGSAAASRLLRHGRALAWFVAAEAVIGVAGIALLPVLPDLARLLPAGAGAGTLPRFLLAFALLLAPTFCMGLSFPTMAAAVLRHDERVGSGIGALYAANALGAVLGAALSGFWWIPAIGLDGAVHVAVALNGAIVVAGLGALARWARSGRTQPAGAGPGSADPGAGGVASAGTRRIALLVVAVTGFVSIANEVAWTKYLVLLAGGTIPGFATILTVFLVGLTAGSAAIRSRLDRIRAPDTWLLLGLIALGVALLWARLALNLLPGLVAADAGTGPTAPLVRLLGVAGVLLPPTFLFGALFPLALRVHCGDTRGVRRDLGRAYAINTVAGVAGSLLAGFWWIPRAGTDSVLTGTALLVLALPLALAARIPARTRVAGLGIAGAAIALAWLGPGLRWEAMIARVRYAPDLPAAAGTPEYRFLREGRTGVISVATWDGRYAHLQNDGLKESLLDLEHPERGPRAETLLGLVPAALRSGARSAFVVGYGGGVTTRALLHAGVPRVRVVELEPLVVDAVAEVLGPAARLDDPALELVIGDARHRLAVEPDRYDLILSQPSHPWRAGASALFTREFFALAGSRLTEGGVFGQWVNLFRMDAGTLLSITRTFFDAFPHGFALSAADTGDLLLFGSNAPLDLSPDRLSELWQREPVRESLATLEVADPLDLLGRFLWSRRDALRHSSDAPWNTDLNVRSETRLAAMSWRAWDDDGADDPYRLLDGTAAFDLEPFLGGDDAAVLSALARHLRDRGDPATARRVIDALRPHDPELARHLTRSLAGGGRAVIAPAAP